MILSTKKTANTRLRYNILTMLVYVIGLILIAQLFNLQIVNGEEYREESNTRLTRETTIEAARGTIRDRTGIELAATKLGNSLEMYKTKIETEQLNECILKIVQVLDKNGDKYVDTFPIKINPYEFTFSTENGLKKWKTNYKIDENATEIEFLGYAKVMGLYIGMTNDLEEYDGMSFESIDDKGTPETSDDETNMYLRVSKTAENYLKMNLSAEKDKSIKQTELSTGDTNHIDLYQISHESTAVMLLIGAEVTNMDSWSRTVGYLNDYVLYFKTAQ